MASKELLKLAATKISYDANQVCDEICNALTSLEPDMLKYNNRTPEEILRSALKHAQEVDSWLRAMKDE